MITVRVANTLAQDDDGAVVAALGQVPTVEGLVADTLVLGLRNAEGHIYRRIEANGVVEAVHISTLLRGFQYAPVADGEGVAAGCQTVFDRPLDVVPFGFSPRRRALRRRRPATYAAEPPQPRQVGIR